MLSPRSVRCLAGAAAVLAACTSPPTTISVDAVAPPGWRGTAEILIHGASGAFVSRMPLVGHADIAATDGAVVTIASRDSAVHLVTYYGVGAGDELHVDVGTWPGAATREITVIPTELGDTDRWAVSSPAGFAIGAATLASPLYLTIPDGRATVPMVAALYDDQAHLLGLFADPAVDVTGPDAHVEYNAAAHTVSVTTPPDAPADADVSVTGGIELGGDEVAAMSDGASDQAAARQQTFPDGFGSRDDVFVDVVENFHYDDLGVSFDGAPPSAVDFGALPIAAPIASAPTYDGARCSWQLTGGTGALYLSWSMTAGAQASWTLVAPPDQTSLALPQLPTDLAPAGAWTPGYLETIAGDYATDYHDALAQTSWPSGVLHWEQRLVPITAR